MTYLSVIVAGVLTYITRMTMITLVDRKILGSNLKKILSYVPAAVFPAIIFPAIFFNEYGNLIEITDPKIYGSIVAIVVGYLSRNIIATIFSGLISYWIIIILI